jgi:hypothetical protein
VQPGQPEVKIQQGIIMADTATLLKIPDYIFSTSEDVTKQTSGKL